MDIQLLTRRQLEILNRRSLGYPLAVAEKDYFLCLALRVLYASHLGQSLVFKGGTALHHCYLPQYRFSEDLDFTSLDHDLRLEDVAQVLEASQFFTVRRQRQSPHTIKIDRLQYRGVLGQPGSAKIEIDTTQNVVLPAQTRNYNNVWDIDVQPATMRLEEICAEKIRATSGRARYRDFYDLYLILTELEVELEDALDLARQKEIRDPILPEAMRANWQIAQEQQSADLRTIFCKREVSNAAIGERLAGLDFAPIV